MPQPLADRPYIQSWLKRVGRQLSGSGRLSQTALALSKTRGGAVEDWRKRLRSMLEGDQLPDPELITDIDRMLGTKAAGKSHSDPIQTLLF